MQRATVDELLDDAPCGYVSFTDDGRIVAVNATLLDMLGYSREEVVGAHVENLLSIPGRIFYQTHFFPLLRLEGRAEEIFLNLRTRRGQTVPALVNAARRERGGRQLNECVVLRLRERQKWEEEIIRAKRAAEEANQAKSRFLSMVSHDLRTPLNAISGYADLMAMGIRGAVTDEQLHDLGRIRSASQFLLSLLDDVLNLARVEARQLEMRLATVQLEALLQQTEALTAPQIAAGGLAYSRGEYAAAVRADGERLQQILLNLLTNAIKFTPQGGSISVACEELRDYVAIRVIDTGPGIAAEHLERIFQPFAQVDNRSTARKKGVGLGLAISRELARAMGGDLTVESVVGQGSTFTLALPRPEPA